MTDQTPRVPDRMPNFWWCPIHHLYRGGVERPCADAVKLGDVEELKRRIRGVLCNYRIGVNDRLDQISDLAEGETPMSDADKLNEIRAAVESWRMHGLPDDRLEQIEDILDRPAAALPTVEAAVNDTPRTLLGWTVPSHVNWAEGNGYLCVECHHGDGGAWGSCGHDDFPADTKWLAPFLASHAHGQVVEHREDKQRVTPTKPPFRSETTWATRQLVKAACDSAMSADTADGWVCAARDTAAVLRTLGMVLGPYHEGLATQCEALADECGQAVEHQPAADSEDEIARLRTLLSVTDGAGEEWHKLASAACKGAGRLSVERDALRAENERLRVLQSFASGDGSQPYYSGTPAFEQWQKDCAERDQLQARINKALALCEPHPLRHLDTQLSIAGILRGEEES